MVYEGAGTATKIWQYADHLGSIIATADATGASTAIYTYGTFGESSLTTGIRYGYTGQRSMAALGLLYYKARFYSPSLGRFLQPDPIGYADDLNLYAYVGNNPVNFTDPSGLVANWAKGTALTGVNAATDFLTGGFGQRASQAINNGELGEALLYTGAGMAFGAMNVLTLGQGTVATGVTKGIANGASNVANAGRLAEQLTVQSSKSPFTAAGTLTKEAIAGSRQIISPDQIKNAAAVPSGFGKYATETFDSLAGKFQAHFYKNPTTGETFFGVDYKAIFNSLSGGPK